MDDINQSHRESLKRLSRDLARAGAELSDQEARFLVDGYYLIQDGRKRANNQLASMKDEPHELLVWFAEQSETLETQVKRALTSYAQSQLIGEWLMSIYGIGPVIAAGLMAHIDISQAPTAGHIWGFAGMDPSKKWEKKTKRPWNPSLKVLCWKVGQSFMKFSGQEECLYGHLYQERKDQEVARNESGRNAEAAAKALAEKNYKKTTDAYKAYITGKLPPAHVDARARRWVVKLFISHLHMVWWFLHNKDLPADPYPIAILGHTHFVPIPNHEMIPGLTKALKKKHWI